MSGDPSWARLLLAARRSLERTGGSTEGTISLAAPTDAERRIVIGITGVHRSEGAGRLVVRLAEIDAYLRQAHGRSLQETVEALHGTPVRNRPAERQREASTRMSMLAQAALCVHAEQDWFGTWLSAIRRDGTLTRLMRNGADFSRIIAALDALPTAEEPMPVFAERLLGNTKALAEAHLSGALLRAIAIWQQTEPPGNAEQERELWEAVGVIPDDLASQVLVLNIPADGGLIGGWLTQAAEAGVPMRVTLHQLRLQTLTITAPEVFVTENPAVLRAATMLGPAAPPMVCSEGVPSAALHRLMSYASGSVCWWRNDFDWAGVRITKAALARYPTARPWRMAAADYRSYCDSGQVLTGTAAHTPWDPELAKAMTRSGRAVMEERLLQVLLEDLKAARARGAKAR